MYQRKERKKIIKIENGNTNQVLDLEMDVDLKIHTKIASK